MMPKHEVRITNENGRSYVAMPNFGVTVSTTSEDSSKYTETIENQSHTVESDNGYVFSRPKYTRSARREFQTGFSQMSNQDKLELEEFYRSRMGGVEPFYYKNPVSGDLIICRFTDKLSFKYKGLGGNHEWDVQFTLKEL